MTLQEYLTSLRHKTVAVIGIGVSNTPLLRRLLAEGIAVTACDRSSREKLGPLADELEAAGATLHLGEGYLDGLTQDVIFHHHRRTAEGGGQNRPRGRQHRSAPVVSGG